MKRFTLGAASLLIVGSLTLFGRTAQAYVNPTSASTSEMDQARKATAAIFATLSRVPGLKQGIGLEGMAVGIEYAFCAIDAGDNAEQQSGCAVAALNAGAGVAKKQPGSTRVQKASAAMSHPAIRPGMCLLKEYRDLFMSGETDLGYLLDPARVVAFALCAGVKADLSMLIGMVDWGSVGADLDEAVSYLENAAVDPAANAVGGWLVETVGEEELQSIVGNGDAVLRALEAYSGVSSTPLSGTRATYGSTEIADLPVVADARATHVTLEYGVYVDADGPPQSMDVGCEVSLVRADDPAKLPAKIPQDGLKLVVANEWIVGAGLVNLDGEPGVLCRVEVSGLEPSTPYRAYVTARHFESGFEDFDSQASTDFRTRDHVEAADFAAEVHRYSKKHYTSRVYVHNTMADLELHWTNTADFARANAPGVPAGVSLYTSAEEPYFQTVDATMRTGLPEGYDFQGLDVDRPIGPDESGYLMNVPRYYGDILYSAIDYDLNFAVSNPAEASAPAEFAMVRVGLDSFAFRHCVIRLSSPECEAGTTALGFIRSPDGLGVGLERYGDLDRYEWKRPPNSLHPIEPTSYNSVLNYDQHSDQNIQVEVPSHLHDRSQAYAPHLAQFYHQGRAYVSKLESRNGNLHLTFADGAADANGNGVSNADEVAMGTDFLDPSLCTAIRARLGESSACPEAVPALWLDANDADGASESGAQVTAGGPISRWRDRSGGGHDAVGYQANKLPTYLTDGIGGQPSVRFADSFMEVRDLDLRPSTHSGLTSIAVLRKNAGQWQEIWVAKENGFSRRAHRLLESSDGEAVLSSWVLQQDASESRKDYWVNGASSLEGGSQTYTEGGVGMGLGALLYAWEGYAGSYSVNYDLAELVVFPRALSSVEREVVEAYLSAKWNL